jgi:predicted MFS family arabinose efflux permease
VTAAPAPAEHAGAGPPALSLPPAQSVPPAPTPWPGLLAGRRGRLLFGLLLTELVVAVQILVVVTVLPEVVRQLGGIRLYGLALSAAALAGIGAAPLAARLLGRYGARAVVPAAALVFGAGALGAGLAGQMVTLVAARLVEGAGAAALGTVAISGVATLYDGADRPRVMVLGNLAWMLPAVAGPAVGSLAVATVGWRWAFTAQLPLLVAAMVLIAPGLGLLRPAARPPGRGVTGPSVVLLAGLLAALAGPTAGGPAGIALAAGGAVAAGIATARIMPPGTLVLRPGLPAATMAMFCCTFAFFAVDGFVPLLLTAVDGRSVAVAGIVVTVATLSWTVGGMVQARLSRRGWAPARLMAVGAAAIGTGIGGTALGLLPGAWLAPYLAWAAGGFGMGLAYTGVWLAVMRAQEDADGLAGSAGGLAGPLVADRLGTALGAGVGGVCIALATRAGLAVGTGIGLGLAFAAASACAVAAAARRT